MVRIASQQDTTNLHLSNIFTEIQYLRSVGSPGLAPRVVELAGMITQLLGNRADMPQLGGVPRLWTLPNAMEYATEKENMATESFVTPKSGKGDKILDPSRDMQLNIGLSGGQINQRPTDVVHVGRTTHDLAEDKEWIRDTNEVLQVLQLPHITTDAIRPPRKESVEVGPEYANEVQDDVDGTTASQNSTAKEGGKRTGISSKKKYRRWASPIQGLEMAGSLLGATAAIVDFTNSLSASASQPTNFIHIEERLLDLGHLLTQVADVIARSDDLHGARAIVHRTSMLQKMLQKELQKELQDKL